jgi:hypothetical protein
MRVKEAVRTAKAYVKDISKKINQRALGWRR